MNKNNLKRFCLLLILLLSACALPPSKEVVKQNMQQELMVLPGAVMSADRLQVSYPDDSLFANGAVLPLPGGMAVIDPLVELLLQNKEFQATGTVRSSGHDAEYDQLLAVKRLEILARIFQNRGLPQERLKWVAEVGTGAPFEVQFQLISSDKSAGEKK